MHLPFELFADAATSSVLIVILLITITVVCIDKLSLSDKLSVHLWNRVQLIHLDFYRPQILLLRSLDMGRVYRYALSTSMILAIVSALPAPAPQLFGSSPSGTTSTTGSNVLGNTLGGPTGILSPILSGPAAPIVSAPAAIPSTGPNASPVGGAAAPVPAIISGTGLLDSLGAALGSALTGTTGSAPNTNTGALSNINTDIGIIEWPAPCHQPLRRSP